MSLEVQFESTESVATFRLLRRTLLFGEIAIDHFWIDKRQIYGQRLRNSENLPELLQFFRRRCLADGAFENPDTCRKYLLATLAPLGRPLGSQRVMTDASLRPQRNARDTDPSSNEELDSLLRQSAGKSMSMQDFRDQTAIALGPAEYSDADRNLYLEISSELLDQPSQLLSEDSYDAVADVSERWRKLSRRFGRRGKCAAEKRILDVLSYEMRTAIHCCYSVVWSALIPAICRGQTNPIQAAMFMGLWHTEFCRPAETDCGELFHLFNGHVFGLHPAPPLIWQSDTGRGIISRWLLAEDAEPTRFGELLHAIFVAVHWYASERDQYNASRRGTRSRQSRSRVSKRGTRSIRPRLRRRPR